MTFNLDLWTISMAVSGVGALACFAAAWWIHWIGR
jgi:hypothetical protein